MLESAFQATIVKRKDITDSLFCLWLDLGENRQKFTFKAGQYCAIGLLGESNSFIRDDNGKDLVRAYSIVSSPREEYLELFIELFPRPYGKLTPLLYKLSVYDNVEIRQRAKGIFTFEREYTNHVMVATVTGIAPFMSMIREYVHSGDGSHRFFVLHGASYYDEFAYDDELACIMKQDQASINLEYVSTISRPDDIRNYHCPSDVEQGRVNTILEKYLETWNLYHSDTLVYACGHPGMIKDVKKRLNPKEWIVKEERYWKD